jgi:pilus assembly protein CpaB
MKREAVFAACAVVLAIFTAMLVRNYTQNAQVVSNVSPQGVEAAQVVVATQDLSLGTRIEEHHVKLIPWPADAIPNGAAREVQAVVGKVALASVVQNEPLMPQKLAAADTQGLMALVIPPGMRAVSVPVNKVTGISGFVSPGTRVDVICIMTQKGEAGGRRAFTLLQDVKVLAVNQTLDERETKPTTADTVTLLVTPEDSHRLTLASAEGTLQLSLRNYGDGDPSDAPGTSTADLGGVAAVAKSNTVQVELIRGPDRIVEHF